MTKRAADAAKFQLVATLVLSCLAGAHLIPASPGEASKANEVPSGWLDQARRQAEAQEYFVTWQQATRLAGLPQAWHAPNRRHNFRTYFTPEGIRVIPRTEPVPSWEWGLSLIGYGRGDVMHRTEPASLSAKENRIEYFRGPVQEWYLNEPRGLKQGFELGLPPEEAEGREASSQNGTSPLALVMELTGTLSAYPAEDRQAIDFLTSEGARVVRYAELVVTDSRGERLSSWMEAFNEDGVRGVRILIDDAGAVYPITVDPLATSPAWTAESDQAGAQFGLSVSTAGDVNGDGYADVIVGANFFDNAQTDEGRAFVYHGSASGLSLTANWTAESNQAGAQFGIRVSTAGDVNGDGYADVIVGAHLFDNPQTDEGRAFVYHGSASGLSSTPNWTAESDQASSRFGNSVSTAGDVNGDGYADVIVGAPFFDNVQADEGRAFVYHGSASGLSLTPNWTAESDQASAQFGASVSTAGDVNGDGYADVIVGAFFFDNVETSEGRAFVYHGSSSGLSLTANWTAESNQATALFGQAVSTAGDVNGDGYADVIVGAPFFDNAQTDEGRAFVYHGSSLGLSLTANWTAESDQANSQFGASVSTAGDVNGDGYADIIVGARFFDDVEVNEGHAFVYHGSASGLALTAGWTAESDQASAAFGGSVATAGDVNGDGYADVIVGAAVFDNVEIDEGRAFVYHGSASGLALASGWTAESDQASAFFGWSVATAGDVNGDGFADVIVGAHHFDSSFVDNGRAFVYHGSASGLSLSPNWGDAISQAGSQFGYSVSTAGDVNGDGYTDIIVGAPSYQNGQVDEGRVFVYHGSASGLSSTPSWTVEGDVAGAVFGASVATAGDVNGDGYADLIVGAGSFNDGRAFVYHGSASGLSLTPSWTAESNQAGAAFGVSVSTAGDVNRDGFADVIVGADSFDNVEINEGRAFVYHGSASGLSLSPNWTAESNQASAQFGNSVSTAGDVNGDGFADVIVGAPYFDIGQADAGRVFVYHGSASGLALTSSWTPGGGQLGALFGGSVSTAGDVNGDGFADVVIGATEFSNGEPVEGRAFVYHGSASGLALTSSWTAESNQDFARFGSSVSTAGDVNGDGFADVIVGAPQFDNVEVNEGRAFLYYGNGGMGLSLRPRQRRSNDAAPIAHIGASESPDSFRLAALGRTPFGRGLVKLEWEVKPLGSLFDGTGIQTSPGWLDSGIAGASLNDLVAGIASGTVHHWRVRIRYHPATTPFQQRSRWLTVPWNGWQEADLRTLPVADLAVALADGPDPLLFANLTYFVNVSNAGPQGAPQTSLRVTLPAGSALVSASPSQGVCGLPAGGIVTCDLGLLAAAAGASVTVTVTPASSGPNTCTAVVSFPGFDSVGNNVAVETTTVVPASPGDRVWEDTDSDGTQDPGEAGLAGVVVALYSGSGLFLDAVVTGPSGTYLFPNQVVGGTYRVRFFPPTGYALTSPDQGGDDALDSDANPVTQLTAPFVLSSVQDRTLWDAGMIIPSCVPPDEPIYIYLVTISTDGNQYPILHFQDGNQLVQVTGYNVYRSDTPSPPPPTWPRVASDVIDMDEATPNKQWVDQSGDPPPGGIWFYRITAFNSRCPAEGPF